MCFPEAKHQLVEGLCSKLGPSKENMADAASVMSVRTRRNGRCAKSRPKAWSLVSMTLLGI